MPLYEYTTARHMVPTIGGQSDFPMAAFQSLGQQGWELINVLPLHAGMNIGYFRRLLPATPEPPARPTGKGKAR